MLLKSFIVIFKRSLEGIGFTHLFVKKIINGGNFDGTFYSVKPVSRYGKVTRECNGP